VPDRGRQSRADFPIEKGQRKTPVSCYKRLIGITEAIVARHTAEAFPFLQ